QPVCLPRWSNALGGQQHVDAAARTEIEHYFAGAQLGERRGVAASEGREQRLGGQASRLARIVEIGGDRIPAFARRAAAARGFRPSAAGPPYRRLRNLLGDGAIALPHDVAYPLEPGRLATLMTRHRSLPF